MAIQKILSPHQKDEAPSAPTDEHVLEIIRALRSIAEGLGRIGDQLDKLIRPSEEEKPPPFKAL